MEQTQEEGTRELWKAMGMTQGERVRELRESMGMTLEQFGAQLGKTKAAMSRIERGRDGLTKSTELLICQVYRVNREWLHDGKGPVFPEAKDNPLDELFDRYNCSELTKGLIRGILELERKGQEASLDTRRGAVDRKGW